MMQVRLGHYTGKTEFFERPREGVEWETHIEYLLVPMGIDRPAEGAAIRRVTCPACGERVGFRVASRRSVTRKRILHVASVLGFGVLSVVLFATDFFGLQGALGVILWAAAIVSAYLVLRFLILVFTRDFTQTIVMPNTDVTFGDFTISKRDPGELNGHRVFPPTGELKSEKSL